MISGLETQVNSVKQSEVEDDSAFRLPSQLLVLTLHDDSFSRDLSRLNSDGESEKGSESSEESSSEEEETVDDSRDRVGQLPPIANSDSEEEPTSNHGLQRNLNSTLSTMSLAPPEEAPATSNSRLGAMNAEKVAQARLERKMAQGAKKGSGAKVKGSGSEESEDENDNRKAGKMMKAADLGVPREMSRREKLVVLSHSSFHS